MANEFLSDEEYLDSLLEKVSQGEDDNKNNIGKELSSEEMEAAADEELQKLLQEAEPNSFDDISIDQLIARQSGDYDGSDSGRDAGEMSLDGLDGSDEDLLGSLDSIVKEMKGDAFEEEPEKDVKPKKAKKVRKAKKAKKAKAGKSFSKKIKDAFFKVEVVDLEEEALEEERRKQAKEEQKKAKALEKEQAKAKKLEDKKAADARKKEEAQKKKAEKERKRQEKLALKAEREAALGPEERVKIKPAFLAFMITIIAVMTIAIMLLSENYAYQNALKIAQKNFVNKNYEEAYRTMSGIEVKKQDQEFYDQIHMMVRLDKQYDAYVNYRELQMPKEALHALIQGLSIYYDSVEMAQAYQLEEELNFQKDTLLYSLANDFGLDEEKAKLICEIDDTNEYTREIELYSANQIQ